MSMIDKDLDCIISNFINPFDWDKTLYKFNRAEKDMNPYSIVNKKDEVIIVHNIVGIDKKDLKLQVKVENHKRYLIIEGRTKDEITEKEYSISSSFEVDDRNLDMKKAKITVDRGLLFIRIPLKKEKIEEAYTIEIQ